MAEIEGREETAAPMAAAAFCLRMLFGLLSVGVALLCFGCDYSRTRV